MARLRGSSTSAPSSSTIDASTPATTPRWVAMPVSIPATVLVPDARVPQRRGVALDVLLDDDLAATRDDDARDRSVLAQVHPLHSLPSVNEGGTHARNQWSDSPSCSSMVRGSPRAAGRTTPTTSPSAVSTSLRRSGRASRATWRSSARQREALAGLGVEEIVKHYENVIRALDEAPVIVGHSYGGLVTELLLDRGLGRAGVAMSPAPPKGILKLPFSTLKAASPALGHPSKRHGVVTLTLEEFTYGFVNTFSPEEAQKAYERYAVPETGQIFYEAGFANFHLHPPTEVHFKNGERAPLLLVGAGEDNTVPRR